MKKTFWGAALRGLAAAGFAALAWRLLAGQDWKPLLHRPEAAAAAAAATAATLFLCAWRLRILLRGAGISVEYRPVLRLVGMSFFAGLVFPGLVGQDAVKLGGFRLVDRDAGLGRVLAVLMVDRLCGLAAVLFWACALALFQSPPADPAARAMLAAARWPFPAIAAAAAAVVLAMRRFQRLPDWLPARLRTPAERAAGFLASPGALGALGRAFLVSAASIGTIMLVQGLIGHSLQSALAGPSPWGLHVFLSTASIMVSALPLAPAGLGVGQAALSQLYARFGLAASAGLLTVTVMQISQVLTAVAVGAASWRLLVPGKGREEKPAVYSVD